MSHRRIPAVETDGEDSDRLYKPRLTVPLAIPSLSLPMHNNPFSEWAASSNASPSPSIVGALPFNLPTSDTAHYTFTFENFSPSIIDSTAYYGHRSSKRAAYHVRNNDPGHGFTRFTKDNGEDFAIIDWTRNMGAVVRLRSQETSLTGSSGMKVNEWLRLSSDRR